MASSSPPRRGLRLFQPRACLSAQATRFTGMEWQDAELHPFRAGNAYLHEADAARALRTLDRALERETSPPTRPALPGTSHAGKRPRHLLLASPRTACGSENAGPADDTPRHSCKKSGKGVFTGATVGNQETKEPRTLPGLLQSLSKRMSPNDDYSAPPLKILHSPDDQSAADVVEQQKRANAARHVSNCQAKGECRCEVDNENGTVMHARKRLHRIESKRRRYANGASDVCSDDEAALSRRTALQVGGEHGTAKSLRNSRVAQMRARTPTHMQGKRNPFQRACPVLSNGKEDVSGAVSRHSGSEFDNLVREGGLDRHLVDKEREGLYSSGTKLSASDGITDGRARARRGTHRETQSARRSSTTARDSPRTSERHCEKKARHGVKKENLVLVPTTLHLATVQEPNIAVASSAQGRKSKRATHSGSESAEPREKPRDILSFAGASRESMAADGKRTDEAVRKSSRLSRMRGTQRRVVPNEIIDLTQDEELSYGAYESRLREQVSHSSAPTESNACQVSTDRTAESAAPKARQKCGPGKNEGRLPSALVRQSGLGNIGIVHVDGPVDLSYVKPRSRYALTSEEEALVDKLTKGGVNRAPVATIPCAGITLCLGDFKRLRNVRWLNDELINAYVALINQRNSLNPGFVAAKEDGVTVHPRTYVFNTYFYTRLTNSGYDYPGVARWTRRANVNVLEKDLILVPINLGNNHWILSGIDRRESCFLYLDSMQGRDTTGVVTSLQHWLYDEVKDKHGSCAADALSVDTWEISVNRYYITSRPTGADPAAQYGVGEKNVMIESASVRRRKHRIPVQKDSGSCGVFTAKIADYLEMGVRVNFSHEDIKKIRGRMALDLYNRKLPG